MGALALVVIYMMPTIIATAGQHKDTGPISIVNLFLGWTFLGWVIALAWSVKK